MNDDKALAPVKIIINEEEQNKKILAWGAYGKALYQADLTLQLQSQEIINQLVDPSTPELVNKAEAAYTVAKKNLNLLQQSRIAVTNKFEPVITRLSAHEKAIQAALKANGEAILKAKQQVNEAAKTKEAKAKELKDIARQVAVYIADMHASQLNAQYALLSKAYEHALSVGISMEALPEFKAKLCARVNTGNCTIPAPRPTFKFNTQEDVDAEVAKYFNPLPPNEYIAGFIQAVESKFSDWEQALQNKEAAKELHEKEVANVAGEITQQLEKQKVAAGLNALAGPILEEPAGKQLKEVWKIAEPQNWDEIFAIINAFAVNRSDVQAHLNKIKPINFGIKQMMAALVAVKTADENFQVSGITFTKIEKL